MPFHQLSADKFVALVQSRPGSDRAALRAVLRAYAPALLAAAGGTDGVAYIAEPRSPWPEVPAVEPGFDACLEFRAAEGRPTLARLAAALVAHGALVHGYRARENVLKGRSGAGDPAPPRGVTLVAAWTLRAGVVVEEALRLWGEHATLALAVHHGADRYVQTWLEAPLTRGAPHFTGIATLRFTSMAGIATGLFRSAEDIPAIEADVAGFIADTVVVYADELR